MTNIDFNQKYKISQKFILFLGRFHTVKGVDTLLESLNQIKNNELYPGANDNASGVYVVLSIAEQLSKLEKRKYNYIFILTDGEEVGLLGAKNIIN